ncbi:sphingosine kinase 1 isoform X1 [Crotalus tigris]|uniref:sphingosine kinase 1 isoform X1 n=2 Tax=Crotalus tigris TaxID=88082 RepID=UPI00192F33A1|nr:sphingosine kinase 1 isoform X1 [Crotalus tigris]
MEGGSGHGVSEKVLLSGVFRLVPSLKVNYALSLTSGAKLLMRRLDSAALSSNAASALSLSTCVGCYAFQSKSASQPAAAYFSVVCYPFKKGWWYRGESRQKVAKTFCVLTSQDAEENRRVAETWVRTIRELSAPSLEGGIYGLLPQKCQVIVLLNPRSGAGQALNLFTSQVQPMLTEASIGFHKFVTEKHNHAWDLARNEDMSKWDAVVIMAGDGLLHEVINGLMERPDWKTAIQKPLCILPGGSGNALASSLNHYARNAPGSKCDHLQREESKSHLAKEELLMNCTYFLCKGLHSPMDLVSLRTASGKRLFSFLSFGWGFVSDVDITSERYRKLGGARFTVGTFQLLTLLQVYKGRLSYLPAEVQSSVSNSLLPTEVNTCPSPQHPHQVSTANGKSPVNILPQPASSLLKEDSVLEDSLLVPFEQPVPKHWTVIPEEEFVSIVCIQQSHLGTDFLFAPTAKLFDDAIHLFYITAGISRMGMLKLFMALEKGSPLPLNNPHVHYLPVKAFRLEPLEPKGFMTIDGEVLTCEPVQGQIHNRLARIINGS